MEINYLGLGADLKQNLFCEFEKNERVLYVFENASTFYEIKKELLKIFQSKKIKYKENNIKLELMKKLGFFIILNL